MANPRRLPAAAILALSAALAAPAWPDSGSGPAQARPRVTGTVWMRTAPAEPAGTFRIFLADGTHVTGSCRETYRLDRWRTVSPGRLAVDEDGVEIPVDVSFAGPELRLRLQLGRDVRQERFRPARAPFLCREGRR